MIVQDLKTRVQAAIDKIRPYLQMEGGDCELVNINEKDGIVSLKLQGACSGCPGAIYTLKMGIETQIKQEVPEINEVIAV